MLSRDALSAKTSIRTFVNEIVVMPDDSLIPGRNAEDLVLNGSVLSTVKNGGR